MNIITGEPVAVTRASSAYAAHRCRCRPGCLTEIRPGDRTTVTAAGPVLLDHAQVGRS